MATEQVLTLPELVLQILEMCDVPELAALSMVDSSLVRVCEKHMQGQVRRLMLALLADDSKLEELKAIWWLTRTRNAAERVVEST